MSPEASADATAATIDRLARIETKIDGMADQKVQLERHTARLDRLERFMWLAVGMSFASGVPAAIQALGGASQ